MRFIGYDYQELEGGGSSGMDDAWDAHWRGREGLKEDLSDELLWPTICGELKVAGRLLEAGCGTGQWVQYLGKLGHDAVGIDFAISGLEVGKSHNPELNLMQADFRDLPFEDDSFDYIVSFGAIEHDVNGPHEALREFCRVLKPTGTLMCSVPCLNFYRKIGYPWLALEKWLKCRKTLRKLLDKKEPFAFYQYIWSVSEYKDILIECGFKMMDLRGYGSIAKSEPAKFVDAVVKRIMPLSSAHMMMAICQLDK